MKKKTATESILNSLDGLGKASPGAFFFTRVQARMQKDEVSLWGRISFFLTKPVVALCTLAVIFLLNAAVLFYQHQSAYATTLADQFEQTGADEYNTTLAANSYYDENTDPR
ncbi:MAG: hypothetical protein ABIQ88_08150 [Chitinophagaceae bacterium]